MAEFTVLNFFGEEPLFTIGRTYDKYVLFAWDYMTEEQNFYAGKGIDDKRLINFMFEIIEQFKLNKKEGA
jgi:hypothetical protein